MNNNIVVEIVNKNKMQVIKKLINHNIYYKNFNVSNNIISLEINYRDLDDIKKLFNKKNVKIVKFYGIRKYKLFLKKYYITLISVLISLAFIFILKNLIFELEIETNNRDLKKVLEIELKEFGIEKYKFKKSYTELEKIKKHIIENNKDKLEWIEIDTLGTKYVVKVTERKLNKKESEERPRSIVAKKDGVIKNITVKNGMPLKELNDFVKKGEVIISGNIIKGEDEVKGTVKANGKVYGEVWYLVNVEVPYVHTEYVKKNKSFNNYFIEIFGKKMSLINYYNLDEYKVGEKEEVEKFYLPFKVFKQKVSEYEYINIKLDKKEAYNKAITLSEKKIKNKLSSDEYIIDKKVLKKEYFRSKINLEVFFKVYENITAYSELEKIKKGSE